MRVQVFRWKAIGPLALFLLIFAILLAIFAEPIARDTTEEAATELLGTQVDLAKLDLYPAAAAVQLRGLQVADPFVLTRNLIQADEIHLDLNPAALAEKKLVIERLRIGGLRFGTEREEPADPPSGSGFAPRIYRGVQEWAEQFNVPLLSLTPIDTIRDLVLEPTQLTTIREAEALLARTDSARKALEQGFQDLDIRPTVDSARALAQRLSQTDLKSLGVEGTKRAIESVRETIAAIQSAKRRLEDLERSVGSGSGILGQGVKALERARQKDVAFAKSLLKLPTFAAPEIGTALFGKVSIDRFKQALYWAELAQQYMPPGLLPRPTPGPQRLRASGHSVSFPRERDYPNFLLEQGSLDFEIEGDSPFRGMYEASVTGITSTPALYGRPAVVTARRRAEGGATGVEVDAVIDHLGAAMHDSVNARLRGITLPSFDLPGLPFRVEPGVGSSSLTFDLRAREIFGRWAVRSDKVSWLPDTAGRQLNEIERQIGRVLSGLKGLEVVAEVRGALSSPALSVSTNLDRAIASRVQELLGEELARAEKMVRAKVDSMVAGKVEPVKQRISAIQSEAKQRIAAERRQLDEVEKALEAELKRLTGSLVPGLKLPKIKL